MGRIEAGDESHYSWVNPTRDRDGGYDMPDRFKDAAIRTIRNNLSDDDAQVIMDMLGLWIDPEMATEVSSDA